MKTMNLKRYLEILDRNGEGNLENPLPNWSIKNIEISYVISEILKLKEYSIEQRFEEKDNYLIIEYILFAVYSSISKNTQRIAMRNITDDPNYFINVRRIGVLFGDPNICKFISKFTNEFTVDISNPLEIVIYVYTRYIDYLNYCVYNRKDSVRDSSSPRFKWIHHAAYFLSIVENGEFNRFIEYCKRLVEQIYISEISESAASPKHSNVYGKVCGRFNDRYISARYDLFDSGNLIDIDSCYTSKTRIVSCLKKLEITSKLIDYEYRYTEVRNLIYLNPTIGLIARLRI